MDERARVLEYLRAHRVMTIATVGENGPAAAATFYANRGLDLYFLSAPHSRHCRNMEADPRVAVTIHEDYAEWSAIKGIQMTATGRELKGAELAAAQQLYAAKFPDASDSEAASGAIARALSRMSWYELAAVQVRFIDNSRGFGHRTEWSRAQFLATARPE
ncbi:MAG TPA: pyridoxamine 5'-phosphate oxidase family protein [Steroidobacteraceae bacterium]|nr:pyridoxamine 5'-phosphate oxidase family protein [Steroidobacteraceae bacterium]HNS27117.1 pyridoxamine 5'-phosphate oxidase family protein [Steroidobacteraceae bacterium]